MKGFNRAVNTVSILRVRFNVQPYRIARILAYEPLHEKTYFGRAPSKASDQPAHSRNLIRIVTVHILDSQGCNVSS